MSDPDQVANTVDAPVGRPVRVQLRRTKGWRMPENTVRVDRSTKYGNPHRVGLCGICGADHSRQEAVDEFRAMLAGDLMLRSSVVRMLRGKNLACWCPLDQPCHADVLLEAANQQLQPRATGEKP